LHLLRRRSGGRKKGGGFDFHSCWKFVKRGKISFPTTSRSALFGGGKRGEKKSCFFAFGNAQQREGKAEYIFQVIQGIAIRSPKQGWGEESPARTTCQKGLANIWGAVECQTRKKKKVSAVFGGEGGGAASSPGEGKKKGRGEPGKTIWVGKTPSLNSTKEGGRFPDPGP